MLAVLTSGPLAAEPHDTERTLAFPPVFRAPRPGTFPGERAPSPGTHSLRHRPCRQGNGDKLWIRIQQVRLLGHQIGLQGKASIGGRWPWPSLPSSACTWRCPHATASLPRGYSPLSCSPCSRLSSSETLAASTGRKRGSESPQASSSHC